MYSVTGFNAPADIRLHGPVLPPQRRSDSTALVWPKHTSGFDIHLCPHACITRSAQHSIYGIMVKATHEELNRMYSADGVGVFLPEAVLVEALDGTLRPAMCYIPPAPANEPPDLDYLEKLLVSRQ